MVSEKCHDVYYTYTRIIKKKTTQPQTVLLAAQEAHYKRASASYNHRGF